MKWFEGTITQAVGTAKSRQAVFVVYIEGTDEASVATTGVLNKENVSSSLSSDGFVAIKLANGDEGHRQFAEIYKLVPAPSVFFIGQNGQAIDVVVGDVNPETVENKLTTAIQKCRNSLKGQMAAPGPSQPEPKPAVESSAAPVPSPGGSTPSTSSATIVNEPPASTLPVEDRVEKAKQLIIQKNEEKKRLEKQKEKEAEIERRKLGQSLQKAKQQKTELELREMREERDKEKREEAQARKRILEQIAQDKAERLQRQRMASASNQQAESTAPEAAQRPTPAQSNSNIGRLQFKLPTGETRAHSFPAETTLSQVRQFIDNNMHLPFSDYEMGTMFPRQQFNRTDNDKDLRLLGLLPSAVILILPTYGSLNPSRNHGITNVIYAFLMTLVSPLMSVTNYVKLFIFGSGRGNTTGDSSTSDSQRPASSSSSSSSQQPTSQSASGGAGPAMRGNPYQSRTIRKRGNIHTLADDNDSNDENNTWNGNSTQQM